MRRRRFQFSAFEFPREPASGFVWPNGGFTSGFDPAPTPSALVGDQVVVLPSPGFDTDQTALADVIVGGKRFGWLAEANAHYVFEYTLSFSSAAGATGVSWAMNGPAAPDLILYNTHTTNTGTLAATRFARAYAAVLAQSGAMLVSPDFNAALVIGQLENGPTPGFVNLMMASGTLGVVKHLEADSVLIWRKISA